MEVVHSFKTEGFLGIKVVWKGNLYYIVNVYSSCSLIKKKELWAKLLFLKDSYRDGEWIIRRDFNSTKNIHERKGRNERVTEIISTFFLTTNVWLSLQSVTTSL